MGQVNSTEELLQVSAFLVSYRRVIKINFITVKFIKFRHFVWKKKAGQDLKNEIEIYSSRLFLLWLNRKNHLKNDLSGVCHIAIIICSTCGNSPVKNNARLSPPNDLSSNQFELIAPIQCGGAKNNSEYHGVSNTKQIDLFWIGGDWQFWRSTRKNPFLWPHYSTNTPATTNRLISFFSSTMLGRILVSRKFNQLFASLHLLAVPCARLDLIRKTPF